MRRLWKAGLAVGLLMAVALGGDSGAAAAAATPQQRQAGVVHELNARNFDSTVSNGRWLVEFYAPWCLSCRSFAPIYAGMAQAIAASPTGGNVRVARVDGWTYSLLCRRFRVRAFPSFLVFQGGYVYEHIGKRSSTGLLTFALPPPVPSAAAAAAAAEDEEASADGKATSSGSRAGKTLPVAAQDDVVVDGVRIDRVFGPMAPHWRVATYFSAIGGDLAAAGRDMSTAQLGGVVVGGGMALTVVIVVSLAVLTAPGFIKHD